eukprot:4084398-Karenia_brevis.AAC.1
MPIGQVGHTWLELYLVSLAFAPDVASLIANKKARAAKCIGAQLKLFKAEVLQILPLLLHDHDRTLFQAAKSGNNRLSSYGVATRLQHTRMLFCLHDACLPHYHLAMASFSHLRTQKQQQLITKGSFVSPVQKFSGKGSFKWKDHVHKLARAIHDNHAVDVATWPCNHDNLHNLHD